MKVFMLLLARWNVADRNGAVSCIFMAMSRTNSAYHGLGFKAALVQDVAMAPNAVNQFPAYRQTRLRILIPFKP